MGVDSQVGLRVYHQLVFDLVAQATKIKRVSMKRIFFSTILISMSVLGTGLASNAATPKLVTCGSKGAPSIVDQVSNRRRELPNSSPSSQVNRAATAPIGEGDTSAKVLIQTGPNGAVRIVDRDRVPTGARILPNSPPKSR